MARNFEVGNKLICKEGFTNAENSGGAGYKPNKVITVKSIDENIIWPYEDRGFGIYKRALKFYNNIFISV